MKREKEIIKEEEGDKQARDGKAYHVLPSLAVRGFFLCCFLCLPPHQHGRSLLLAHVSSILSSSLLIALTLFAEQTAARAVWAKLGYVVALQYL
jgi:hypothetical protein